MKLLLDTHIWLWSVYDPEPLVSQVSVAMQAAGNEIWLSPVSIWELTNLVRRRRFAVDRPVLEWLAAARSVLHWREAALTEEVAIENARMNWAHRDPSDRFLVATARVYDLTLVTADRVIAASGLCNVLANV